MNLIATVSDEGEVHHMAYREAMTGALFIGFLERLLGETRGKLFLIVNRLRAHDTKQVRAWVADHDDRIELFHLPRRAPERNPEEYLNNNLKGAIGATGLPESRDHLRSRIERFMDWLGEVPEHVRGYFQHPSVQYATISNI